MIRQNPQDDHETCMRSLTNGVVTTPVATTAEAVGAAAPAQTKAALVPVETTRTPARFQGLRAFVARVTGMGPLALRTKPFPAAKLTIDEIKVALKDVSAGLITGLADYHAAVARAADAGGSTTLEPKREAQFVAVARDLLVAESTKARKGLDEYLAGMNHATMGLVNASRALARAAQLSDIESLLAIKHGKVDRKILELTHEPPRYERAASRALDVLARHLNRECFWQEQYASLSNDIVDGANLVDTTLVNAGRIATCYAETDTARRASQLAERCREIIARATDASAIPQVEATWLLPPVAFSFRPMLDSLRHHLDNQDIAGALGAATKLFIAFAARGPVNLPDDHAELRPLLDRLYGNAMYPPPGTPVSAAPHELRAHFARTSNLVNFGPEVADLRATALTAIDALPPGRVGMPSSAVGVGLGPSIKLLDALLLRSGRT